MWMVPTLQLQTMWIDGIFRDHEGVPFLHFAEKVSIDSVIQTQVIDNCEGIPIAAASRWPRIASFLVELDSQNVVSWSPTMLRFRRGLKTLSRNVSYIFLTHIQFYHAHLLIW